jgi:hypothetical protein
VEGQWQYWQRSVVTAFSSVAAAFGCLGGAPAAASTEAPAPGSSMTALCVKVAAEATADSSCRAGSESVTSCCSAACSSMQVSACSSEGANQTNATSSSSRQHVKVGPPAAPAAAQPTVGSSSGSLSCQTAKLGDVQGRWTA